MPIISISTSPLFLFLVLLHVCYGIFLLSSFLTHCKFFQLISWVSIYLYHCFLSLYFPCTGLTILFFLFSLSPLSRPFSFSHFFSFSSPFVVVLLRDQERTSIKRVIIETQESVCLWVGSPSLRFIWFWLLRSQIVYGLLLRFTHFYNDDVTKEMKSCSVECLFVTICNHLRPKKLSYPRNTD